jgi:hypothetical protein
VTGRTAADRALAVTEAWLAEGASERVLGVNTYEGVAWFAREGWRELIDWALLLDLVDAPDDAQTSAAVAAMLLAAGDASGYRIDRLREALGGKPVGAARGAKKRATAATTTSGRRGGEPTTDRRGR